MCAINVICLYLLERGLNTTLSSNLAGHLGNLISVISEDPSLLCLCRAKVFWFFKAQPKHSSAPEKAVAAAFPSKHPSCHFPFFLDCLFLPSAATHNSTLNQLPLIGQVLSSPHGKSLAYSRLWPFPPA